MGGGGTRTPVLIGKHKRDLDRLFQQQGRETVAGATHTYNSLLLSCKFLTVPDIHPNGQAWAVWATARQQKTRGSMKKKDARPTKRSRSSCRRNAWLTKRLTVCCYWVRLEGERRAERTSKSTASAGRAGRTGAARTARDLAAARDSGQLLKSWLVLENACDALG